MFMSEKYIDGILKEEHEYLLPIGFAERVAALAMAESAPSMWEFLFRLTPRAGVAFGAVAIVLAVVGFVADGPNLVESVSNYASLTELFPLQ